MATQNGPNVIHNIMTTKVGPEALWKSRFEQAFNEWAEETAIQYTEVGDDGAPWFDSPGSATRGDIRVVSANIDGPSNVLAFNYFPNTGDMLMDSSENWGSGTTDLFLRQVISHENGHGMGLPHSCPQQGSKLMEPGLNTNFEGPQRDDRLAIQYRYGDRYEPNNTLGTAENLADLGLESDDLLQLTKLSLRNASDGDLFSFEAASGSVVNQIQVAPQGTTYQIASQNGQTGACNPSSPWDSLRQLDLRFELLDESGSVVTAVDNTGLGDFEELNDFALQAGGKYYIRVRSSGPGQSITPVQEYRLLVNVSLGSITGDLNGDGFVNGVDLAILLASWGGDGPADLTGNNIVNGADLATLLASWTGS